MRRRRRAAILALLLLALGLPAAVAVSVFRATRVLVLPFGNPGPTGTLYRERGWRDRLLLGVTPSGDVAVGYPGELAIWSLSGDRLLRRIPVDTGVEYTGTTREVAAVSFSRDGKLAAALAFAGEQVFVLSLDDGKLLRTHDLKERVWAIAISPDGKTVAASTDDGRIHRWSVATGDALPTIATGQGTVFAIAFAPDGTRLASGGEDGHVKLWNVADGSAVWTAGSVPGQVADVACSPDGGHVASVEGAAILLSSAAGAPERRLKGGDAHLARVVFDPDGDRVVALDRGGRLWSWPIEGGSGQVECETATGNVDAIALTPAGEVLGQTYRTVWLYPLRARLRFHLARGSVIPNGQ
jgi:WD40 repeat protein